MDSPLCFIARPCFDGILLYCLMKEKYGNILVEFDKGVIAELPIIQHPDGFPLSSLMFFEKSIEYLGSWKKRWDNKNDDLSDFKKRKRKFPTGEGLLKSYDMPLNLWNIPRVWFYFQSHDVQRVQYLLLTQLAGIGKKVSQGYGFYRSFDIREENEISFDSHILRPRKIGISSTTKLIKRIWKKNDGFTLSQRFCSWRPPYTLSENFEKCFYPGDME